VELVLTGRGASEELIGIADYVSNIQKIKHPFDRKIVGRVGIEF
jgi:cob(I)alamin adenosyltransferase